MALVRPPPGLELPIDWQDKMFLKDALREWKRVITAWVKRWRAMQEVICTHNRVDVEWLIDSFEKNPSKRGWEKAMMIARRRCRCPLCPVLQDIQQLTDEIVEWRPIGIASPCVYLAYTATFG